METRELTDEEWIQEWKETFPKSLLSDEDLNELLTNPNLADNKWVSVKYIKSKSNMGLRESAIYYDLWLNKDIDKCVI